MDLYMGGGGGGVAGSQAALEVLVYEQLGVKMRCWGDLQGL